MNAEIQQVIDDWQSTISIYSYEKRNWRYAEPRQITANIPFIDILFSIVVDGFYLDKELKLPIKLHKVQVSIVNKDILSTKDIENFRQKLEKFTEETYKEFEDILQTNKSNGTCFTTDRNFF